VKNIANQILATVIAAGIIGNVSIWYSFGQRLARIETVLKIKTEAIQLSKNHD
jgi:hypothetical protein